MNLATGPCIPNYRENYLSRCSRDTIDGSLKIVLLNLLQLYDNGCNKRQSSKRLQRKLCMVSQEKRIANNQSSRFKEAEIKEHSLVNPRTTGDRENGM